MHITAPRVRSTNSTQVIHPTHFVKQEVHYLISTVPNFWSKEIEIIFCFLIIFPHTPVGQQKSILSATLDNVLNDSLRQVAFLYLLESTQCSPQFLPRI